MPYNSDIHHRRTIRLSDHDYASVGAYFITICANGHECIFGEVRNGIMYLNELGNTVREEWLRSKEIRKEITLDEFVIMPNHIHGIIIISDVGADGVRPDYDDTQRNPRRGGWHPPDSPTTPRSWGARRAPLRASKSLGSFVAGFKSVVTKQVNALRGGPGIPIWQRNYFERVIRNDRELAAIREYIVNNPAKWLLDKENPTNYNRSGRAAVHPDYGN